MMDETGGNGSPSGTPGATPIQPQPATGTPPETGATPEDGNEAISVDSYRRLQTEAKKARLELKEVREALRQRDEKDLTEAEKLAKRAQDIEAKEALLAQRERATEVKDAALAAGASKPDVIARLVDPDEDIGRAIARLKRELPELFYNRGTAGTTNGGASGTPSAGSPSDAMNAFIRGRAGRG